MDSDLFERFIEDNALRELTCVQQLHRLAAHLQTLTAKAYPDGPQVIVQGDDWRGQLVVRLEDVKRLLGTVAVADSPFGAPTAR